MLDAVDALSAAQDPFSFPNSLADATAPAKTEPVVLLDATNSTQRAAQLGVVFVGILFLAMAGPVLKKSITGPAGIIGGTFAIVGLGVMALGFAIQVRWDVTWKGHPIRFENDPFRGERLTIDGRRVATGKTGRNVTMRAAIESGEGAGDQILATSVAGFTKFQCRIVVEPATHSAR